ncbi:TIGR03808 family TAT-translocated repetitive protein [Maritalea mediterranea]|uniref:TIGR03808 family TAT-translocated repetitive protein n=1 Tax=Maritalea mediterranea TaxID=2909667 RepID=A0ABS9E4U8_9HYPH|nr:TIGR03808 family TAT-translocated repetitive protein [Maritalea mediterranea]MCF4097896.1 TIGR03808 family TAT-translocated repetitive protein [Maritalea mediterranea]
MVSRRQFLLAGGASFLGGAASLGLSTPLLAQNAVNGALLDGRNFGLTPGAPYDQAEALTTAVNAANSAKQKLFLPAGSYNVSNVGLPSNTQIIGAGAATKLVQMSDKPIFTMVGAQHISLERFDLVGAQDLAANAILYMQSVRNVNIEECGFFASAKHGVLGYDAQVHLNANRFEQMGSAAIFLNNGLRSQVRGNVIKGCGNNGILIWRDEPGYDGTIVAQNQIEAIEWRSGGNGQNGNGINVFRSQNVIVANNIIRDCAFTAVRANGTRNTQIIGNNCKNLGEVAIFSEFGFSGSLISDNLIDEAATGISITNYNDGGYLAVCANNIVRNIWEKSPNNPDTIPLGIAAEADCSLTGNVVENVPGAGLLLGWGPFHRNLLASGNLVRKCKYGIAASAVEGDGPINITGNSLFECEQPMVGSKWMDIAFNDLATESPDHIYVTNNVVN